MAVARTRVAVRAAGGSGTVAAVAGSAASGTVVAVDLVAGLIAPRLISRTASTASVALVAGGALLLGGDRVEISIDVAPGCRLEVIDVGGTVAYDAQGLSSSWTVRVTVGAGGELSWHGLPLVVATGADVTRSTRLELGVGARALLRETTVLGRSGEVGGRLVAGSDVRLAGEPVLVEEIVVDGARGEPGILGAHRVFDTVVAVGFTPPVTALDLTFDQPGALSRFLGAHAHLSGLDHVWETWRNSMEESDVDHHR